MAEKGEGKGLFSRGNVIKMGVGVGILVGGIWTLNALGIYHAPGLSASTQAQAVNAQVVSPGATAPSAEICNLPLGSTQTTEISLKDADQRATAITGVTATLFTDVKNAGIVSNVTIPGALYTIESTKTGYFAAVDTIKTSCTIAGPQITQYMKAVDTSMTINFLNSDGLTANANTPAGNESVGNNAPVNFVMRLKPSALYKHLSGAPNKYSVWITATNTTVWDLSKFTMTSFDGSQCVRTTQPNPTAITTGTLLLGFDCNGDFSGQDANYRNVGVGIKANGNPGANITAASNMDFYVVGWDYFQNTVTGALSQGAVKDDGSAIQTLQMSPYYYS